MDSVTRCFPSVFFMNNLPQAPENKIRVILNFFEHWRRYFQAKLHHRCQLHHRWQIMGTISDCLHLKENLNLYVNSTIQRCPNKIFKLFWLKIFPFATGVNNTGGAPWASKKIELALIRYSGAGRKLIHEKNLKSKISLITPVANLPQV